MYVNVFACILIDVLKNVISNIFDQYIDQSFFFDSQMIGNAYNSNSCRRKTRAESLMNFLH